jgi:hypothetical protein
MEHLKNYLSRNQLPEEFPKKLKESVNEELVSNYRYADSGLPFYQEMQQQLPKLAT